MICCQTFLGENLQNAVLIDLTITYQAHAINKFEEADDNRRQAQENVEQLKAKIYSLNVRIQ